MYQWVYYISVSYLWCIANWCFIPVNIFWRTCLVFIIPKYSTMKFQRTKYVCHVSNVFVLLCLKDTAFHGWLLWNDKYKYVLEKHGYHSSGIFTCLPWLPRNLHCIVAIRICNILTIVVNCCSKMSLHEAILILLISLRLGYSQTPGKWKLLWCMRIMWHIIFMHVEVANTAACYSYTLVFHCN